MLTAVSRRCAPEGIRTPNLLIRSQMLYPLSYGRMAWWPRTIVAEHRRRSEIDAAGRIAATTGTAAAALAAARRRAPRPRRLGPPQRPAKLRATTNSATN